MPSVVLYHNNALILLAIDMIKKPALFLLVSLLVFLTACDSPQQSNKVFEPQNIIEKVENVAWMREKLPASTLAYMRMPTLWELLFEAKVDALHGVQKLDAHINQINQFKQGIIDTYSELLPLEARATFKALIKDMTTPLEVAIINATDGSMVPNTLIATTLKDTRNDDLDGLLKTLAKEFGPQLKIISPLNPQGRAKIMAAMVPVFISFDEKNGQLALFSGLTASEKGLHEMLLQNQHATELDNIFAFEDSVDQAGKNLEFWLNIKAIYQQNKGFIPPNMQPMMTQMGLDKVEYLWAGTASKNGKSELIFRVAMPDVGFRQFMPTTNAEFNIKTAGIPRSVWQITTPTEQQFIQGYELFLSFQSDPDKKRKEVNEGIDQINEFMGVSLSEILNTYGQKNLVVTDDSGTWFAFRIKDLKAHAQIIEKLSQAFSTKASTKQLAGVDINQSMLSFKDIMNKLIEEDISVNPLSDIVDSLQYSYYQIEDNYVIQATTPQVLADRANSQNKIDLDSWLNKQQGHNWDNAIFAYSKEVIDAPRDIYYGYLKALLFIGSLTNTEVDLFALPTAQQLELPQKGRFGFALDSSSDALTMKLSYEYSILEGMSSSSPMVVIGVVGILMAYAIPAYRDYTLRSKVGSLYYPAVTVLKIGIAEHYKKHNTFPNTEFFSEYPDFLYNPKNGEIIFYFTHENLPELAGKSITITPRVHKDGYLRWDCTSNLNEQYLLANCYYEKEF